MHKALVELIGTFFLVLVIGLTVIAPGAGMMAPVAIGAILTAMVYAGGPISGAHYNPAVTVAVWLRGKIEAVELLWYIGAQLIGALLASLAVQVLQPASLTPFRPDVLSALLVEFVFTFALAFVVLNVATAKRAAGNSYYGLAIGFTVLAAAYAGGAISGGAYNPAVALGITAMGLAAPADLWIFVVANLAGGVLAGFAFRALHPNG